jgi:hypothetical protein
MSTTIEKTTCFLKKICYNTPIGRLKMHYLFGWKRVRHMTNPNESVNLSHAHAAQPVVGIWWWAMLVIAVLAVPSFGFLVSLSVSNEGYGKLVVFVLACWFCTYMGMRLMNFTPKNK